MNRRLRSCTKSVAIKKIRLYFVCEQINPAMQVSFLCLISGLLWSVRKATVSSKQRSTTTLAAKCNGTKTSLSCSWNFVDQRFLNETIDKGCLNYFLIPNVRNYRCMNWTLSLFIWRSHGYSLSMLLQIVTELIYNLPKVMVSENPSKFWVCLVRLKFWLIFSRTLQTHSL